MNTSFKKYAALAAVSMSVGLASAQVTETTLHSFTGSSEGALPNGNLIIDHTGNLYGTTLNGGNATNNGTVFKLSPPAQSGGGYTLSTLYAFSGGSDGAQPAAGLLLGMDGSIYGTAENSNGQPNGVVFKISSASGGAPQYSVIYNFTGGADGGFPNSNLIIDASGALYGTTTLGGASGDGTVFKLTPSSGGTYTETVLYSFTGGMDGSQPYAGLVMDARGSLYGTATFGGVNNSGTVFKVYPSSTPGTYTFTTLYNFTGGADGSEPYGGLFLNPNAGVLYGMTFLGGSGSGVIYTISAPTTMGGPYTQTVIHTFSETDGANPSSALRYNTGNSKLYGATFDFMGYGNVFSLTAPAQAGGAWTENVIYSFMGGTGGANPLDNPTFGGNAVYGTTYFGGASNLGTIYRLGQ